MAEDPFFLPLGLASRLVLLLVMVPRRGRHERLTTAIEWPWVGRNFQALAHRRHQTSASASSAVSADAG